MVKKVVEEHDAEAFKAAHKAIGDAIEMCLQSAGTQWTYGTLMRAVKAIEESWWTDIQSERVRETVQSISAAAQRVGAKIQ